MSSEAPRMKTEDEQSMLTPSAARGRSSHAAKTPTKALTFSVIPGIGSGGPAATIVRRGKEYCVGDITAVLRSSNDAARLAAIQTLVATELSNRNELCLVASTLYDIASVDGPIAGAAYEGLVQLLSAHFEHPEAIHLALQAIRLWEGNPPSTPAYATLIDRLRHQLPTDAGLASPSRTQFLETAHILSQALITTSHREPALAALCRYLEERTPARAATRRELAGLVLAALRKIGRIPEDLAAIKILATTVLTTGTAATGTQRKRAPVIQPQNSELVTAQQAEQRRQFGLAVTIEIIKSLPLLGRPMTADEFENALRFNFSSGSLLPANRFWPSKSEWYTIERALEYAEQNQCFSPLRLAAFAKLLATRIKVEDPKDPRESKRRPDTLPTEARLKVLATSTRIQSAYNASAEEVDLLCEDLAARLLAPEFSQWTAQLEPIENQPHSSAEDEKQLKTLALLQRVLADPSGKTVARLQTDELYALGSLQSLTLQEFKELTRLLQSRAVSDLFARNALMSLTQAVHKPEVSAVVRTAALASLLGEARRRGTLSADFEREVFAISAKIPQMSFS